MMKSFEIMRLWAKQKLVEKCVNHDDFFMLLTDIRLRAEASLLTTSSLPELF